MFVEGLNHFLFSVSDLEKSIKFYQDVFDAKLLVKGRSTAYFDLNGMWLALNLERNIPRDEISQSYTHVAFSIDEADFDSVYNKIKNVCLLTVTNCMLWLFRFVRWVLKFCHLLPTYSSISSIA